MSDRMPRTRRARLFHWIEIRKEVSLEVAAKVGGEQQRVRAASPLFRGCFGKH